MIDKRAFARELEQLADRFNREVSKPMLRRYHEFLTERMDDEAFRRAASIIYQHDRFWPPPARFLEAVGLDPDTRAGEAWEQLMATVRSGGGVNPRELDDPALAAGIRAVGGTARLGTVNEDRLPWIRKEFTAAYRASAEGERDTPALKPPGMEELTG